MIRNGQKFVNSTENDYRLMISNERLHEICQTRDVEYFIRHRQTKYMSHVIRMDANRPPPDLNRPKKPRLNKVKVTMALALIFTVHCSKNKILGVSCWYLLIKISFQRNFPRFGRRGLIFNVNFINLIL